MDLPPRRILVVQTWGVGDTLMTVGLFRTARTFFPSARLAALVAFQDIGDALCSAGVIDEFWTIPRGASGFEYARAFLRLRGERFDLAIVATRLSWVYAALCRWIARVPTVITDAQSRLLRGSAVIVTTDRKEPRFVANAKLLRPVVPPVEAAHAGVCDGQVSIPQPSRKARALVEALTETPVGPVYAIHLGSGGQPVKRIPVTVAQKVVEQIVAVQPHSRFLYIEGPSDPSYSSLPPSMQARMVNVSGLSIADLLCLLPRCEAVLSGDTGVMHIAASGGGRVVVVVGPGDIVRARPWGEGHEFIKTRKPPPCMPCYGTAKFGNCPLGVECMTSVAADDIVAAMIARRCRGQATPHL